MIKLNKGNEPAILRENKSAWTATLLELLDQGAKVPKSLSAKYNHAEIKDCLRAECFSKCMYCESKVEFSSDFHIEHIKPKAKDRFPELTFDYENLGLACTICNRNKSDTYNEILPFINPYSDEPATHFSPFGALIRAKPADARAEFTINELKLNRNELLEHRREKRNKIKLLIRCYHGTDHGKLKKSLKRSIIREVEKDKIYAFVSKPLVEHLLSESFLGV